MMQNRKLSKAIGQTGWNMFLTQLEYKSKLKGKKTIKIDRWEPSTKTCSNCGNKQDMTLDKRIYSCSCGLEMDRDLNAAINIARIGFEIYTAGIAEINASGVSVSQPSRKTKVAGTKKLEIIDSNQ